ncbi:MAG: hypothetical protein JXR94_07295 [Candidatus Hydrogenedentes bacterium]|nr:hypothetical protein [Candidatus Hydrogenedentota bacterium]
MTWERVGTGEDPFGLPRDIAARLKDCVQSEDAPQDLAIEFLWVYISEDGVGEGASRSDGRRPLVLDEWLAVIDEAAALGATTIIMSLGCRLSERPEVPAMMEWAQSTHGMSVGLHVYNQPMSQDEIRPLLGLDQALTCLFASRDILDDMRFAERMGIRLCEAECQEKPVVSPTCTFPEVMPCVGAYGGMYTCGLVLGDETYRLGNVFDRKLASIMADEKLPHIVPEGVPKLKRTCNGCPPLMARRLKGLR